MRNLLFFCLLLFTLSVSAQIESSYVMAASFSATAPVNGSTVAHTATLAFQADQLGEGYLGNQIKVGDRVLTSTKRQYRVTAISTSSLFSASVTLLEIGTTTLGPNGVAVVYSYDGTDYIPVLPSNATGISASLLAVIINHDLEVLKGAVSGPGSFDTTAIYNRFGQVQTAIDALNAKPDNVGLTTVATSAPITGNGTTGNPIKYVRPVPTWAEISGKPTVFPSGDDSSTNELQTWANLPGKPSTFPSGDDVIGNEDNDLVIFEGKIYTTKPNGDRIGAGIIAPSIFGNSYRFDAGPESISYGAFYSGAPSTTIPTFTGSGSAGYALALANGYFIGFEVTGTSANSNTSGEFVLYVDDALDGVQGYAFQLYDLTNNQKVDEHITGNIFKQELESGRLRISIPNVSGSYPNGFRLIAN